MPGSGAITITCSDDTMVCSPLSFDSVVCFVVDFVVSRWGWGWAALRCTVPSTFLVSSLPSLDFILSVLSMSLVVIVTVALLMGSVALLNDSLLILSAAFWTLSSFSLVIETLSLTVSLVVTSGFLNELRNDDATDNTADDDDTADDNAAAAPKDFTSAG